MKILRNIIVIAIIACIMPAVTTQQWGGAAMAQHVNYKEIDPLDTLDEEDLQRMRDTTMMSRINRAEGKGAVNALNYVLHDTYEPYNHTFDNHWYDHIYVGASMGMEKIHPQTSTYSFRTLSQVNLLVGKELDKKNSLRLSLGGGWGYMKETEKWLRRAQMRLDYLFNLSTHFYGYNPARRIEASLLLGVGANYTWMNSSNKLFAPEAHFGVQLKCFTGPLGTINVEPFVGISSDKIDISGSRNWHGYDVFYGLNVNYACFLVDNLSKEARMQLLQSRMVDDRMVNKNTVETWRTPWFIEYSMGPVFSSSDYLGTSKTLGNQTSISVGRWLSPVMGFRVSAVTRSNRWMQYKLQEESDDMLQNYNSHYFSGRVEGLLNPFGFLRNFKWSSPWGAYLTFGGEFGSLTKYMENGQRLRTYSESYNLGAHFWYAISQDLQAFVEPRYSHNVYSVPYSNVDMRKRYGSNNFGLDFGLTLLIRSQTYRDPYEMDNTQNFTYRKNRGFVVGLGLGMPVLQNKDVYYNKKGMNWNAMAFLEYRFNHLHAVRGHLEQITINRGAPGNNIMYNMNRKIAVGALNYEINVTNLCSGRFKERRIELEAFAGFAMGKLYKTKMEYDGMQPISIDEKFGMFGGDFGLKLSAHIWNGISAYLTPTIYALRNKNKAVVRGFSTMSIADFGLYQTINVGVQYKIGSLHRNALVVREIHRKQDRTWNSKQLETIREEQRKHDEKVLQRKLRDMQKKRH